MYIYVCFLSSLSLSLVYTYMHVSPASPSVYYVCVYVRVHICMYSLVLIYIYMCAYLCVYMHLVLVLHASTCIIRAYVFACFDVTFLLLLSFTSVLQVQRKFNLCCPGIHLHSHSRPFLGFSVAVAL